MPGQKAKPYPKRLKELLAKKSKVLSQARAFSEMGMEESALPLWSAAAAHEERLAPLLETLGRNLEAALHRVSAASCYQRSGDLSRAANLYRAALAGPLRNDTHEEVEQLLSTCLRQLAQVALLPAGRN